MQFWIEKFCICQTKKLQNYETLWRSHGFQGIERDHRSLTEYKGRGGGEVDYWRQIRGGRDHKKYSRALGGSEKKIIIKNKKPSSPQSPLRRQIMIDH